MNESILFWIVGILYLMFKFCLYLWNNIQFCPHISIFNVSKRNHLSPCSRINTFRTIVTRNFKSTFQYGYCKLKPCVFGKSNSKMQARRLDWIHLSGFIRQSREISGNSWKIFKGLQSSYFDVLWVSYDILNVAYLFCVIIKN